MIVLGIDPGTARMGYGILQFIPKKKIVLLTHGVFITPPEMEQHKRLLLLHQNLTIIIKEHSPDVMVVEKLFFNTNAKTAMTVGQARGITMLASASNEIPFTEYTALQAKLTITGYGRSDKKQMQTAVKDTLKLKEIIKSDDANDAVAMALCYLKKVHEC